MSFENEDKEYIREFANKFGHCYQSAKITFIGLKSNGENVLSIIGKIWLNPTTLLNPTSFRYDFGDFVAMEQEFNLSEGGLSCIVDNIFNGFIKLSDGHILKVCVDNKFDTNLYPIYYSIQDHWPRTCTLEITPRNTDFYNRRVLYESLVAGEKPFDGINDLCIALSLPPEENRLVLEFTPIMIIDKSETRIDCNNLEISILTPSSIDKSKIRVGVRPFSSKFERYSVTGSALNWTSKGTYLKGMISLQESAHAAQIFLSYDDQAIDKYWFVDPKKHPNPYTLISKAAENINHGQRGIYDKFISTTDSKLFEQLISLLFHNLGFRVINYGSLCTDFPDIIASPNPAEFLIIECTTGIPDAKKLSALASRSGAIRDVLNSAGLGYVKLRSILATQVSADTLGPVIKDALILDIVIISSEWLSELNNQSGYIQDPLIVLNKFDEALSKKEQK